ncbi:hypothetical protein D5H75_08165 [Bailinhaonella thermotolerans]|uniref:Uncharacterized protein n=1 Tax=Bailinhaonella thermotolerans TaxID=1070861 RepID=A0A3A4AVZ9_9ACTN|nr:hypothetical protein D5H75_08165 [Bailinhaonella thermotolerans]
MAVAAVLAQAAPAAADAPTTIRRDGPHGTAYSGSWQGLNSGTVRVASAGPGIAITALCSSFTLGGDVGSDGTGGTLDTVTASGCRNNMGGTTTITAENLPYANPGQTITYVGPNPGVNARLTISAPGLRLKAVMPMATFPTQTCHYGFGATADRLELDVYNRDNPSRPQLIDETQAVLQDEPLDRLSGSTSLCPSKIRLTGVLVLRGESFAGSGAHDQRLYVTP